MCVCVCVCVAMTDDRDRFRLYSESERQRAVRTLRGMRQQLVHERSLKLDAFHHVEDLLQQVRGHSY